MHSSAEIVERLRACLENHSPALREGLRAALTERTFPPHPRFKGRSAPALDEQDALSGIHVEYSYPGWVPIICGLSHAAAVKCGARYPLGLRIASLVDSDLDDVDPELAGKFVEAWIVGAWRAVRGIAPELRGYVFHPRHHLEGRHGHGCYGTGGRDGVGVALRPRQSPTFKKA